MLKEAIECFRFGFFDGAIERCEKLKEMSRTLEIASAGVDWLSRVYSGSKEHHKVAQWSKFITPIVRSSHGGSCVAELSWLFFEFWDGNRWQFPNGVELQEKSPFQQVLSFLDNQHGVLVSFHPTAVLSLARLAADESHREIAKSLVNCVLGWRSAFAEVADLEELARLMIELGTPIVLWSDWAAYFYQHVQISNARDIHSASFVDADDFAEWAAMQNRESEDVLTRILKVGPPELPTIMKTMVPHFAWSGFDEPLSRIASRVIQSRSESELESDFPAVCDASWYSHPDIKARYFWYDMLDQHEQSFVTNGDWALFCTPTDDYSMGLAQWWRLIESVFGRIVTSDLGKLFDANPQWLVHDRENLSEKSANTEAVFLKKLAVADSREKMTLFDILLVVEKCVVKPRPPEKCDSMLRLKATEYFAPHSKQILDSIQAKQSQQYLSRENIDWFRNRASHVEAISEADACVGRLVAKRIVDLLFTPQLKAWGFNATIPVLVDDKDNLFPD